MGDSTFRSCGSPSSSAHVNMFRFDNCRGIPGIVQEVQVRDKCREVAANLVFTFLSRDTMLPAFLNRLNFSNERCTRLEDG